MLIFIDRGATLCPTSVQSKQCSLWPAEFEQTSIYDRLNANGVLSYRNRCFHRRSSGNSEDSDHHGYYNTGFIETPIIDSTDNRDRYHTETQSWFMRQLLNPLLFVVLFFYLRQRDALRFVPNMTEVGCQTKHRKTKHLNVLTSKRPNKVGCQTKHL